jgi:1-acyl-sn-glycerol-3-phosphate acyltransferase
VENPWRAIVSTVSITVIALGLLFWLPWLVLVAILRMLLPLASVTHFCESATEWIYRAAVRFDTLWLRDVLGLEMRIEGELGKLRSGVIVSNHRSWLDILLLQWLITHDGPIIKFLVKKELIWVPIVGWICLAMNFPRLNRSRIVAEREADYERIREASLELRDVSGALLVFAEGTRFTEKKRLEQGSPYRALLVPKVGGLRIMKENLPGDTPIVDVTLGYPADAQSFWRGLSGSLDHVAVRVRRSSLADVEDVRAWLDARWKEKDRWLETNRR